MSYYIGVDLGTSSMKLLLVDEIGNIVSSVSKEYPVYFPNPGWSEQNPNDWWNAFIEGTKELICEIDKEEISGISVAGQMHGLVILSDDDNVIRPAILWNDGRTAEQSKYLNETVGEKKLAEYTANISFAGFTAPKLMWLYENEPDNFSKISKIMLPKDYIIYRLTGEFTTDYSDASGMLLLDVEHRCWSDKMLRICKISSEKLPRLCESYEKVGCVVSSVSAVLGLKDDVTVAAGAADNAAAALGCGAVHQGMCNISLGTSGTLFIPCDNFEALSNNAIHNFCHANGKYHLMGCILSAAVCNKWFCEEILNTSDFDSEQAAFDDEKAGENNIFFLPYLMGERSPINDSSARAAFIGMSLDTTRSDMVAAVLEGVAFAIRDNFEAAKLAGIEIKECTLCGGGAKSQKWRKILSNVLNIKILLPQTEEGPALGAAFLAMVADGIYSDIESCVDKFIKIDERIFPDETAAALYEERYKEYRMLYPALKNFYSIKQI